MPTRFAITNIARRAALLLVLGPGLTAATLAPAATQSASQTPDDRFLLIGNDLSRASVRLGSLDRQKLHYMDPGRGWRSAAVQQCVALVRPDARRHSPDNGYVKLADGQLLPGAALSNAEPDREALVWNHPWIGRMVLPLDAIASVVFDTGAQPPEARASDVVLLANGDTLDGFIVELGDPVVIEVESPDGPSMVTLPAERVAALTLVTPQRTSNRQRVWFEDGTIVDVQRLLVGDDGYARLWPTPAGDTILQAERPLRTVLGIFFDASAMTPLATLRPESITGPETRYTIPAPRMLDARAVGHLSPIEYRGPLTARYMLPEGATRFAAVAELPEQSRAWGDFELVIECAGRELFREHLTPGRPTASINVPITGRDFAITLNAAAHGPIQDRLVLRQAMFLVNGQ